MVRGGLKEVGTFVLNLLCDFAVSIFYLLWLGDIHLEHRKALRAGFSQFLCSRAFFIQHSGEHRETQLVQMLGQSMTETGISTCKSRDNRVSSNRCNWQNCFTRMASRDVYDSLGSLKKGSLGNFFFVGC